MAKTILITGASGLIGHSLSAALRKAGHTVKHLGRYKPQTPGVDEYIWDVEAGTIEPGALEGTEIIIHLAGANVGKGRWTEKRKTEIISSRVRTLELLQLHCSRLGVKPEGFMGASAVGYYGTLPAAKAHTEEDAAGADFMAAVCRDWEQAARAWASSGTPVTLLRIGVVLSGRGGALPLMAMPVRWFAGAPMGSGRQVLSWIHIQDLAGIFHYCMEHSLYGVYNAVSPHPVTNRDFIRAIGRQLRRPVWPVPVPGFVLRTVLGEQAAIVLDGVDASADKILNAGYTFRYSQLQTALADLLV